MNILIQKVYFFWSEWKLIIAMIVFFSCVGLLAYYDLKCNLYLSLMVGYSLFSSFIFILDEIRGRIEKKDSSNQNFV